MRDTGTERPRLVSPRLRYRELESRDLDSFHGLATDDHVRRFLLDGSLVDRSWSRAEIARSRALFAEASVGLWIAELDRLDVGFVGFRVFEEIEPEPQLMYAFRREVTGCGLATEAARALLDFAAMLGWDRVLSAVDEPNRASIRVLEKAGFVPRGEVPGAFGRILLFKATLAHRNGAANRSGDTPAERGGGGRSR